MYNEAIMLGILVSLLYTEFTGLSAGLIIPGYLALYLNSPLRLGYTLAVAAAAVGLCHILSRMVILYGRRRFAIQMVCAAGNDGFGTLFKVVVFTGLRLGEALGLTWDCVDFSKRRLTIDKQLQKRPIADGGFVFASLKNDKIRVIAPAPYVLDLLKKWEQRQKEFRLRCGAEWQGWNNEQERKNALVFTNELGGHLHPQTVYNHFKKLAALVGAPHARVHDLRHTYAVLSLQNGDDVKTVQGNLGHATAAFIRPCFRAHERGQRQPDAAVY